MTAQQQFSALVEWMYRYDDVAVAFSGGVCSALLVCAAQEAHGKDALILTANTPFFTKEELYRVHEVLDDYKVRDARVPVYLLQDEDIAVNDGRRCGLCRKSMLESLLDAAKGMGAQVLTEGTCAACDSGCGRQTDIARELGVKSPLLECGYTRQDAVNMLRAIGRGYYLKPAHGCLTEQVAPGEILTVEVLDFLEEAEKYLRGLAGEGRVYWDRGGVRIRTQNSVTEDARRRLEAVLMEMGASSVVFERNTEQHEK